MRKINKLRENRGFTLVETSVSTVLLLILIATASAIIITGGNIFARNTLYNAAEIIGNDMYKFISDKVSCADRLYTDDIKAVYGEVAAMPYFEQIYIPADGSSASLIRYTHNTENEAFDFFSKNRLSGFRTAVSFETSELNDGSYIMTLTVGVYNSEIAEENLKYTKQGTFKLYNMKANCLWSIDETSNSASNALYITYTYID